LRHWLEVRGTGKKTTADETLTASLLKPTSAPSVASVASVASRPDDVEETPGQHIARLEGRVAELEVQTTKRATERESFARRPSISPGRRAGEPLSVRRRPLHHLRGEAAV